MTRILIVLLIISALAVGGVWYLKREQAFTADETRAERIQKNVVEVQQIGETPDPVLSDFTSSVCERGLMTLDECNWACSMEHDCVFIEWQSGTKCYDCRARTAIECPQGTSPNKASCEAVCPADGKCIDRNGCFSCIVVNCPDGLSKNTCPSHCELGCDVAMEESGVQCMKCKKSCTEICTEQGLSTQTDYSEEILAELQKTSCVTGVSVTIGTATIGSCTCTQDPIVTFDKEKPVCRNTDCGDVECGKVESCMDDGLVVHTVDCGWKGWEKIGTNQFQPVVNVK